MQHVQYLSICLRYDCVFRSKKPLLLALIPTIAKLVHLHESNQTLFVDGGIAQHIIAVTRVRNKDLQLAAVQTIHRLVERNAYTSRCVLEQNAVPSLLQLLKKHEREPTMTVGTRFLIGPVDHESRYRCYH